MSVVSIPLEPLSHDNFANVLDDVPVHQKNTSWFLVITNNARKSTSCFQFKSQTLEFCCFLQLPYYHLH